MDILYYKHEIKLNMVCCFKCKEVYNRKL